MVLLKFLNNFAVLLCCLCRLFTVCALVLLIVFFRVNMVMQSL